MPGRETERQLELSSPGSGEEVEARLRWLEEVTTALLSATTPKEVAEAALSRLMQALAARSGAVLSQGGIAFGLTVLRVLGVEEDLLARSTEGLTENPVREAWQSASPIFLEAEEEIARRYPGFAARVGSLPHGALVAVPLKVEERVLGMVVLGYEHPHPFPREERELALSFGRILARALERVELLVAERAARAEAVAARRRLSFLDAVSGVLNATLDERAMGARVVALAVPTLSEWAAIFTVRDGESPVILASSGPQALGDMALTLVLREPGRRLFLESPLPSPEVLEASPGEDLGPLSLALAPLGARGQAFGVLALASADPARRYGQEDLLLLGDVANRTALALEHARLYREARTDARVLEDFMHVASHELRGPLSTLQLAVQLLARDLERNNPEKVKERISLLRKQTERLSRLSLALLDVSRISSGQLSLVREELDLVLLAREVLNRQKDEAEAAGVTVSLEALEKVSCLADPERIEQVISNLLSNSLKYGRGSPVLLRVSAEEGYAVISVKDQGIGIAKENQERVFERFERVEPKNAGGLGLGLWISKGLVLAHGGRIELTSEPGKGTTFTVRLPRGGG